MRRNTGIPCEEFEVCYCMRTYQDYDIQNVDILYRDVSSDFQMYRGKYYIL